MITDQTRRGLIFVAALLSITAVGGITAAYFASANRKGQVQRAEQMTSGDAALGLAAVEKYGCGSCHNGPGLPRLAPGIAPPLEGLGSRAYIAGVMENNPENLVRWIINPPAVDPLTAMPNVGVTEADARNIAAFLYAQE